MTEAKPDAIAFNPEEESGVYVATRTIDCSALPGGFRLEQGERVFFRRYRNGQVRMMIAGQAGGYAPLYAIESAEVARHLIYFLDLRPA